MGFIIQTWSTALLHDALEDTDAIDAQMIEMAFGPTVASNVIFLTKVAGEGGAYIKRIQTAPSDVQLVKIADRIDNLRSLQFGTLEFQQKQLLETEEKYLGLLGRKFDFAGSAYKASLILHDTFHAAQKDFSIAKKS